MSGITDSGGGLSSMGGIGDFANGVLEGYSGVAGRTPDYGSSMPYGIGAGLGQLGGLATGLQSDPISTIIQAIAQAQGGGMARGPATRILGGGRSASAPQGGFIHRLIASYTGGLLNGQNMGAGG